MIRGAIGIPALATLLACGTVSEDPIDAAADIDTQIATDAPAIDALQLGPWGAPALVANVSTTMYSEDDPSVTADELELYFASNRPGTGAEDIWVSKRATTSDPWPAATEVTELNSASNDGTPEVSPDGLTIWFGRSSAGTSYDIMVSTRASRTSAWSTPVPVTELNTISSEKSVRVTPDALTMFLATDRSGAATGDDVWKSTRTNLGANWSTPVPVTSLNSASGDHGASPALGATLIVFASSRNGTMFDLFSATAPDFTPVLIDELSDDAYAESDPELSEDARTIYFTDSRGGTQDINVARR